MARPRANDFELKRRSIVDGAAAVFAQQGMDKASMSQIGARAGVSKALLYHYFPSKDSLVFAIIREHIVALEQALADAVDEALTPAGQLECFVAVVLDRYRGAEHAHQVQLNCGAMLGNDQRNEIRTIERRIVRYFSEVLLRVNPRLEEPGRPLLMPVTMSLFGMLNWVYTWFRDDGTLTREDYARLATRLMLDGIGAVDRS
ncbi:MAG: TetR/AcrR family transcriptional regulator [Burkholderiaceae bacterium]